MKTLVLKNNFQMNMTMLPNSFVDHYMANANGEFVKVYLFLLRHVEDAASSLSISMIADYLNNTRIMLLRAFRYWESVGLLDLDTDRTVESLPLNFFAMKKRILVEIQLIFPAVHQAIHRIQFQLSLR